MTLEVASELMPALLREARAAQPREACGLLFGDDGRIHSHCPTPNIHPTPDRNFEIDPKALILAHRAMRGGGPRLAGYYHSHPHGPPEPSATDRAMAARDAMIWAIIGQGEVRFWRAGTDGFEPLPYRVTGE